MSTLKSPTVRADVCQRTARRANPFHLPSVSSYLRTHTPGSSQDAVYGTSGVRVHRVGGSSRRNAVLGGPSLYRQHLFVDNCALPYRQHLCDLPGPSLYRQHLFVDNCTQPHPLSPFKRANQLLAAPLFLSSLHSALPHLFQRLVCQASGKRQDVQTHLSVGQRDT